MQHVIEVQAQLGRAGMLSDEFVAMEVGSVVKLDKEAGDPVDLLVDGMLIARGPTLGGFSGRELRDAR